MSHTLIASGAADVVLSSTGRSQVMIVAAIAIGALLVAGYLVREVLAAGEGTDSMKNIAAAVQEGATAYLNRQFKTLSVFVVLVFSQVSIYSVYIYIHLYISIYTCTM